VPHDQVVPAVRLAEVVDLRDVRVAQPGGVPGLPLIAAGERACLGPGGYQLDQHVEPGFGAAAPVDVGSGPAAQEVSDAEWAELLPDQVSSHRCLGRCWCADELLCQV